MTPNDRSATTEVVARSAAERLHSLDDYRELARRNHAGVHSCAGACLAHVVEAADQALAAARREGAQAAIEQIRGVVRAKRAMYFSQTDSANTLNDILRHLDAIASDASVPEPPTEAGGERCAECGGLRCPTCGYGCVDSLEAHPSGEQEERSDG